MFKPPSMRPSLNLQSARAHDALNANAAISTCNRHVLMMHSMRETVSRCRTVHREADKGIVQRHSAHEAATPAVASSQLSTVLREYAPLHAKMYCRGHRPKLNFGYN